MHVSSYFFHFSIYPGVAANIKMRSFINRSFVAKLLSTTCPSKAAAKVREASGPSGHFPQLWDAVGKPSLFRGYIS